MHIHWYNNLKYVSSLKQSIYYCSCGKAKFTSKQAEAQAAHFLVEKVKENMDEIVSKLVLLK